MIVLDLGQEVSNATSTPASSSLANTMMTSTPSNNGKVNFSFFREMNIFKKNCQINFYFILVLSDILQMTGIMGSEDETIQEQQQQQHEAVHLQQPRLETKTLKKGEVKIFFREINMQFFLEIIPKQKVTSIWLFTF